MRTGLKDRKCGELTGFLFTLFVKSADKGAIRALAAPSLELIEPRSRPLSDHFDAAVFAIANPTLQTQAASLLFG